MKEHVKFVKDENAVESIIHKRTKEDLGYIRYDDKWKKYVADFDDLYFDADCLIQIAEHLRVLDKDRCTKNEK